MIDDPAMVADVILRTTEERPQASPTGSAKATTLLS